MSRTFTSSVPTAPVITTATGSVFTDTATIAGTITASQGVVEIGLYIGGVFVAACEPTGTAWSLEIPVSAGASTITAKARNEVGLSSASGSIVITATAPAAPTITTVTGTVYTDTATVSGTITVGQGVISVEVLVGGVVVASATPSGTSWSVPVELALGANVITARALNEVGTGSASGSVTLTAAAPTAPVISTATGSVYDLVATVAGTITAGQGTAYVEVLVGLSVVAAAIPTGTAWSVQIPLSVGANLITARSVNEVGTSSVSTLKTLTASVPGAPTISSPVDGATVVSGSITVSGTATHADRVDVYVDGVLGASAVVSGGAWSCTVVVTAGAERTLTAKAVNGVGTSSASAGVGVTLTVTILGAPTMTAEAEGTTNALITLLTIPTGANKVHIYRETTASGFSTLATTLSAAGTFSDGPFNVGQVITYIAVGVLDTTTPETTGYASNDHSVTIGTASTPKRELIKLDIMSDLEGITTANGYPIQVKTVTDDFKSWQTTNIQDFPVLTVITGDEQWEYALNNRIQSRLDAAVIGYIHEKAVLNNHRSLDHALNDLIFSVRKCLLNSAKNRNTNAIMTYIRDVNVMIAPPFAVMEMSVSVQYRETDVY